MNKISPREFINVNIAFASFLDGERIGQESIDASGNEYVWSGTVLGWIQTASNGAAHVRLSDSDVASDADRFLNTEGVVALAASGVHVTGDVSGYTHGVLIVSGTGTVTITGSPDGTNYSAALQVYNAATVPKAAIAATALAAGTYYVDSLAFQNLKFTEAGGAATVTVVMGLKA